MAAYSIKGDDWIFYEIDPSVQRIAEDPKYFTYLSETEAGVRIVVGDARIALKSAPNNYFDLLALDTFSSDAIPAHLLTKEAMELYRTKLKPDGIVAFNITNRYLDFSGVLGGVAQDAALQGVIARDSKNPKPLGHCASSWVVVARGQESLDPFLAMPRWRRLDDDATNFVIWSDDFSNLIPCFKWDKFFCGWSP